MIYNLYIFNRKGKCLYYREWHRPLNTLEHDQLEEQRLMFGMLYSIKELVTKMSQDPKTAALHALKTGSYTLHHLETSSGLRFVLNTDNNAGDLRANLHHLYSRIYVEHVIKHPQYVPGDGNRIRLPGFDSKLEEYLRGLACFSS
ncbi:unnamed protein product [Discosporangium mesarthrocarpum]